MSRVSVTIDRALRLQIGPRSDGLIVSVQLSAVAAQDAADVLNEACGRRAPALGAAFAIQLDADVSFETVAPEETGAHTRED